MRQPTELMQAILTSPKAQEMIDYVSPIYGNSYVGLWLFQAIGTVMEKVYAIAEALKYETNPATADLFLDYWEDHYGITRGNGLTQEQRRLRIIAKTQDRGPCNPAVLESAVSSALGGVPVEITENYATNTFLVNIREVVSDITPAIAVLERQKPAHLIYDIRVAKQTITTAELKTAIAVVHAEMFKKVEVLQ